MKATHSVKVNGVWYRAGSEIPALIAEVTQEAVETTENVQDVVGRRYTKSEIRLMNAADVRKLAASRGIENAEGYSANALKEMLIKNM